MATASARIAALLIACTSCDRAVEPGADARIHVGFPKEPFGRVEIRANFGPARLARIWLSATSVSWGDAIYVRVTTSSNVAVVEVRQFGYGRALRKRGIGIFSGIVHVPALPPYLHPAYRSELRIIARSARASDEARASLFLH